MSEQPLRAVVATFRSLDDWGQRLGAVYTPDPGSELAGDDSDWPGLPLSQVTVASLSAARDHLHAVRVLIEAQQLFPFAQASLVRAALLSAAQGVWILAPDRQDARLRNARTLTAHVYDQHRQFLRDLQRLPPVPHPGTDAVAHHLDLRSQQLAQRRLADGQRAKFNATEVVEAAALATWGTPEVALEARVEWRRGSGAAHGLLWSVLGQAGTRATQVDPDGMAELTAGGAIDNFANGYLAAHQLLQRAFTLLDRRGTVHAASVSMGGDQPE